MSTYRRLAATTLVCVALVATSCAAETSDNPTPSATTATTHAPAAPISHVANLRSLMDSAVTDGGVLAWTVVESSTDAAGRYDPLLELTEVLWASDRGEAAVGAVLPIRSYSDIQLPNIEAVELAKGDRVLALAIDGVVFTVAKEVEAGMFQRPEEPASFHTMALASAVGQPVELFAAPPSRGCDSSHSDAPDEAPATFVDALTAYLEGSTAIQQWEQDQQRLVELDRLVDQILISVPETIDAVTGEAVPHNDYDIYQQLLDGVSADAVKVGPTVPFFWELGSLAQPITVVVATSDLQHLLGYLELRPGQTSNFANAESVLETFVGSPPNGQSITVSTAPQDAFAGCQTPQDFLEHLSRVGSDIVDIGFDDAAGSRRALVDPAAATVETVDSEAIASLTS